MKKLKEKFGKYFQFKNTINGTNYFLRGLAIFLFFIPSVIIFFLGMWSIENEYFVLAILFSLLGILFMVNFVLMIWFLLATTFKRINAFFPNNSKLLTFLTFAFSFIVEFFNPNDLMDFDPELMQTQVDYTNPFSSLTYVILALVSTLWYLYLVLGNSPIEKNSHVG